MEIVFGKLYNWALFIAGAICKKKTYFVLNDILHISDNIVDKKNNQNLIKPYNLKFLFCYWKLIWNKKMQV